MVLGYPKIVRGVTIKLVEVEKVDNEDTGARMRTLRLAASVGLRELSRRIGYSAPYLSDLENGRRNWTWQKVLVYKEGLNRNPPSRLPPPP